MFIEKFLEFLLWYPPQRRSAVSELVSPEEVSSQPPFDRPGMNSEVSCHFIPRHEFHTFMVCHPVPSCQSWFRLWSFGILRLLPIGLQNFLKQEIEGPV